MVSWKRLKLFKPLRVLMKLVNVPHYIDAILREGFKCWPLGCFDVCRPVSCVLKLLRSKHWLSAGSVIQVDTFDYWVWGVQNVGSFERFFKVANRNVLSPPLHIGIRKNMSVKVNMKVKVMVQMSNYVLEEKIVMWSHLVC